MRVLIADDDSILRLALGRQLAKWGLEPVVCADGLAVRALIQQERIPPLALIDWNMPGVDGRTLCGEIRAMPAASTAYLILITSNRSRADVVSGLTCGADDYIVKPFDWEELRARVNIGARTAALQEQLRILALQDDLTNLYNRRGFTTLADRHLALARRNRRSLLLIAADIDDLKSINDQYGHAAGDQVVRAAAHVLRTTYRSADIVARLGGDEFAVFPLEASTECAEMLLARLRKNVEAYNAQNSWPWRLSISAGIAQLDAGSCTSVEQFLDEADRALYQQKRQRRAAIAQGLLFFFALARCSFILEGWWSSSLCLL
jgi:two-component system cell cycle response regulator